MQMASVKDVAVFMCEKISKNPCLYQEEIVWEILQKFGGSFVYTNRNGNWAITKDVLREFRKMVEGKVVWERRSRLWRKRESYDPIGKRQVD